MFRPNAKMLIEVAQEALVSRILPSLSEDARYDGMMITNALRIALRELEGSDHVTQTWERNARTIDTMLGEPSERTVAGYKRHMALAIRKGRSEDNGSSSPLIKDFLQADVSARLSIDNPKVLAE
jgi:hypothetical protein